MARERDVLSIPNLFAPVCADHFTLLVDAVGGDNIDNITKRNDEAEVTILASACKNYCSNCEVPQPQRTVRYNPSERDESVDTLCQRCFEQLADAAIDHHNRRDDPLAITPADTYTAVWFDAIPHPVRKHHTPMLERKLTEARGADYAVGGGFKQSGDPVQVTTTQQASDTACEICGTAEARDFVRLHYDDPNRLTDTTSYCPMCADALRRTVADYTDANVGTLLADAL